MQYVEGRKQKGLTWCEWI